MSSYQSGSSATPSGFDTQTPNPLPANAFPSAVLAIPGTIYDDTHKVLINGQTSGSYFMAFGVTGSIGTTTCGPGEMTEVYNTAGAGADAQQVVFDVSAHAWSGSGGPAAGAVTFIIEGGL